MSIAPDTFLWCEGMSDWKTANEIPDLQSLFTPTQKNLSPPLPAKTPNQVTYKKPKMGALKVLSIFSLIFSTLLMGLGVGVAITRNYCYDWSTGCECYHSSHENAIIVTMIFLIAIFMLLYSIIGTVKAFTSYVQK